MNEEKENTGIGSNGPATVQYNFCRPAHDEQQQQQAAAAAAAGAAAALCMHISTYQVYYITS